MPIQYRCLCLQLVKLRWNELFCSWEIANRRLFFGGEFTAFCGNFSRKRKLWFSLLSDGYNFKPRPNDRNIVGCRASCVRLATLLRHVATCWRLLAQIWQFTTWRRPICRDTAQHGSQTCATCCDMLGWHVAIVWLVQIEQGTCFAEFFY